MIHIMNLALGSPSPNNKEIYKFHLPKVMGDFLVIHQGIPQFTLRFSPKHSPDIHPIWWRLRKISPGVFLFFQVISIFDLSNLFKKQIYYTKLLCPHEFLSDYASYFILGKILNHITIFYFLQRQWSSLDIGIKCYAF